MQRFNNSCKFQTEVLFAHTLEKNWRKQQALSAFAQKFNTLDYKIIKYIFCK